MTNSVTNPNKKILRVILAAAAVLILCGVFCTAAAAAGDGNETSPYEISTANNLTLFLTNAEGWTGQYGKIVTSIDVTGGDIAVTGTASKNLDLNGTTIKAAGGKFTNGLLNWGSSGNLTITDSVGSTNLSKRGSISGNSKTRPLYLDKGTVNMTSGKLTDGNVGRRGGGVFMNSGRFELSGNAGIEGNYAKGSGGGVYMNSGTFTMSGDSRIIGSNSDWGGGGVYLNSGEFTMKDNASISGNHQYGNAENGGGVYVEKGCTFTMMDNTSISGNTAVEGGGADIRGTFTMSGDSRISKNSARYGGGGVYVGDGSFTMTDNSTIGGAGAGDGNSATEGEGGGLYLVGGWVSINSDGAKIIGNTAKTNGGGVYNGANYGSGGFTLSCGSITKNTANNGGGVYSTRPVIITGCNISENTAKSSGGGVYSTSRVTLSGNTSITNNTANVNGGGVFMNGGTFEMSENSRIFKNSATNGDGGGVYIWSAAYAMTGGEIIGNSAGGKGGGVYFAGTSYSMTGGEITQNSAAGDGGGVYYNGGGTNLILNGGNPVISGNTKSGGTTADNLWVTNPAHIRLDSPMGEGTDIRVTSPTPYPGDEFGDSKARFYDEPNKGGAMFIKSDDGGLCGRITDVANLAWIWDDTETETVEFK